VKIQTREALVLIIAQEKNREKTVVTTNGCFDLMHVGHLRYLQAARNLGDLLVVGVNSDNSVRQLKGEKRPLIPADERAEMLAGLDCVNYVVIFPELDPISLLSELKPDIHVKGGDYTIEQVIERQIVEENGGQIIVGLNVKGKSTTNMIQNILNRF
jgi:rfaE bifunctional protein nucleotidyltransferase chain/domain